MARSLVESSLGLMNVDGVTRRRVEYGADVADVCGRTAANETGFDVGIGCKAANTSDLGTAERVILG